MRAKHRTSRFALWPLAVAVALEASLYSTLTPLLPNLRRSMDLDVAATGALFSTYVVGALVGAVVAPWLQARASTRAIVRISLCTIAISGLGFALSGTFVPAGAFRFVGGGAGGLVWATCLGWSLRASSPGSRGAAVGLVMGAGIAGTVAGPLLGNLALVVGLVPAFAFVAVASGLLAVVLPPDDAQAAPEESPTRPGGMSRNLIIVGGALTYGVVATCYGAIFLLLPLRLSNDGLSDIWIGWTFTAAAIGSASVSLMAGRAVDRIGATPLIVTSLAATSLIMAIFVPRLNMALTVVLVLLAAGFALPLAVTPVAAAIALDAESLGVGRVTGPLLMIVFSLGEILGSVAGGAIAEHLSDGFVTGALSLLAATSIVIVLVTGRMRSRTLSA